MGDDIHYQIRNVDCWTFQYYNIYSIFFSSIYTILYTIFYYILIAATTSRNIFTYVYLAITEVLIWHNKPPNVWSPFLISKEDTVEPIFKFLTKKLKNCWHHIYLQLFENNNKFIQDTYSHNNTNTMMLTTVLGSWSWIPKSQTFMERAGARA